MSDEKQQNHDAEPNEDRRSQDPVSECSCMPKANFSTFILSLASSTLVQLGEAPDPASGKTGVDIDLAKHSIDILSILQEKTKNNLDLDEKRLLDGLLYELRMKYIVRK